MGVSGARLPSAGRPLFVCYRLCLPLVRTVLPVSIAAAQLPLFSQRCCCCYYCCCSCCCSPVAAAATAAASVLPALLLLLLPLLQLLLFSCSCCCYCSCLCSPGATAAATTAAAAAAVLPWLLLLLQLPLFSRRCCCCYYRYYSCCCSPVAAAATATASVLLALLLVHAYYARHCAPVHSTVLLPFSIASAPAFLCFCLQVNKTIQMASKDIEEEEKESRGPTPPLCSYLPSFTKGCPSIPFPYCSLSQAYACPPKPSRILSPPFGYPSILFSSFPRRRCPYNALPSRTTLSLPNELF